MARPAIPVRPTHAVVLGAGMAGMLASSMLARHFDAVTILDRDLLPAEPALRKGIPQAKHAHLLWSGGARIMESLLPGITGQLLNAGARRAVVHRDVISLSAFGWQHRFAAPEFMITCSRALLDYAIRAKVLSHQKITVLQGTEPVGLRGDMTRVTGILARDTSTGAVTALDADLVADATGRGSSLKQMLASLGMPPAAVDTVDPGLVYATRIFRAPPGATEKFPVVSLHADHRLGQPGRNGVVLPIEDSRWIITLSGTRGAEPTSDAGDFAEFAARLRHPLVAELIAAAEPLTDVQVSRSTVNRRNYYERTACWPDGLVVLGDSLVALDPLYGHGMSAAARGVQALNQEIKLRGLNPGLAVHAQRAIAAAVDDAWLLSTSQDICYPGCVAILNDPPPPEVTAVQRDLAEIVGTAALREPTVSAAYSSVVALAEPVASLAGEHVVAALRRGALQAGLAHPPITPDERALLSARTPQLSANRTGW